MLKEIPDITFKAVVCCLLLVAGASVFADPHYKRIQSTVEGARITVSTKGDNKSVGTLQAKNIGCSQCPVSTYSFDTSTILINPFGAQKPVSELRSWSGGKAWFHYRTETKHIDKIHIMQ